MRNLNSAVWPSASASSPSDAASTPVPMRSSVPSEMPSPITCPANGATIRCWPAIPRPQPVPPPAVLTGGTIPLRSVLREGGGVSGRVRPIPAVSRPAPAPRRAPAASDTRTRLAASPSGMKVSALATRAIRPGEAGVDERGDARPRRRRRSAGSRRRPAPGRSPSASRSRSSTGSGASQRRSSTRAPTPVRRQPPGRPQAHRYSPLPKVTMVRSLPVAVRPAATDRHVGSRQRSGASYGASQPPSPGSCRSRVW